MGLKFVTEHLTIPAEGKQLESRCNSFTIINYGTETLIVNDVHTLPQRGQIIISGLQGEMDTTVYRFKWGTTGGTKNAVVIRKKYVGSK